MITRELPYADGPLALRGYLAFDETHTARRPGVLVVPEAPGLTEHAKRRVRMLADDGYVAMGVDLYGQGRLANGMEELMAWLSQLRTDATVWRRRIQVALDALSAFELTDTRRLAAIGYCFGGSSALELARSGAPLRAAVCFHGELLTASPAPRGITTRLLVCTGSSDPIVPAEQRSAFETEMEQAGADWQLIVFGGAKHGFTSTESDSAGLPMLRYQAEADRRSWRAMREWLRESCDV
jgi:dienelactone hydrolase